MTRDWGTAPRKRQETTKYDRGFWDFTSDLSSKDTAYTSLGLEAHTDTTYFSDPAGLQLFHLLSHTDGSGGESLLVDGFRAAEILKREDPAAYRTLSEVGVWSHASGNEGVSIRPYKAFPVLQHEPWTGGLVQVRWNNADRAGLDVGFSRIQEWYDAAAYVLHPLLFSIVYLAPAENADMVVAASSTRY
ncbi:hypothetical protein LTR66_009980 [Elasticomyces elasticus]|nr:hypothetical protein LTR66_009980 [Elasticomyces elasticus]